MNRKIITVIAAVVLLTVITMLIKRETSFVSQPAGIAVQETYPKRMIRNVEVKNYNIVGEKISFYDRVPQRVVAVGENINETLVALGVEDKIICSVKYGNPYYVPEEKYALLLLKAFKQDAPVQFSSAFKQRKTTIFFIILFSSAAADKLC